MIYDLKLFRGRVDAIACEIIIISPIFTNEVSNCWEICQAQHIENSARLIKNFLCEKHFSEPKL